MNDMVIVRNFAYGSKFESIQFMRLLDLDGSGLVNSNQTLPSLLPTSDLKQNSIDMERRRKASDLNESGLSRRRRVDREWINIGAPDADDEYDDSESVMEYSVIHPSSGRRHTEEDLLKLQESAYEMVKTASKDHEDEKLGSHAHWTIHSPPHHVNSPLPIEWYTFRIGSMSVGFDLEMWWRRSGKFLRLNALFLVVLAIIFLAHLVVGIIFITMHFTQTIKDPYTCGTEECVKASSYFEQTMNLSVDPCDNFYEFVCGNYKETETGTKLFRELLSEPGFKLELGEPSLLSKILKDFKHDPTYDQSIRYYQSCLDEKNKAENGIETLLGRIEFIFGTRDFKAFNAGTEPLEEVGIRLYKTVGHAYFLNMAFSAYPYIQLIRPTERLTTLLDYEGTKNRLFVEHVFNFFMPKLGLDPGSADITEMVNALGVWSTILRTIYDIMRDIDFADGGAVTKFYADLDSKLKEKCAPMAINLNYKTILDGFIGTTWEEEYYDRTTKKYWDGLKWCLNKTGSFNFSDNNLTSQRQRLAFVSPWLYGLFHDLIMVMDSNFLLTFINEPDDVWEKTPAADYIYFVWRHLNVEQKCLNELWTALGYLPSLRFVLANEPNPVDFIQERIYEIHELFGQTKRLFFRIPKEEIHPFMALQGRLIFERELQAEIIMPFIGDIFDTFRDKLSFTDDHLNNHYVALNLTAESGRLYWLASADRLRAPKWWGYGGPQKMRDQLLDLRFPFVYSARYDDESIGAFTEGIWETFLGRKDFNYIVFPLTLYNEPHSDEMLALRASGNIYKITRSILGLVHQITDNTNYPYFNDIDADKDLTKLLDRRAAMRKDGSSIYSDHPINNEPCQTIVIMRKGIDQEYHRFKYEMESHPIHTISSNQRHELNELFMNLMAMKFAYRYFENHKHRQHELNYTSQLDYLERIFRLRRRLPGAMEKYNQDQIFFLSFVRHYCLQSWKKTNDHTKGFRYELEVDVLNVLINSMEFQKVWKCKQDSFMNKRGQPKCFNWVPGDDFLT